MSQHHRINYIEFAGRDMDALKTFYATVFGWKFTDYGPQYVAFSDGQLEGGFNAASEPGRGPLVIIYSDNLEETRAAVSQHGGVISQDIYSFPGGRRFHFLDPSENELAVWGE